MYSTAECVLYTKYRADTNDGAGFGPKTTDSDAALKAPLSSEMDLAESDINREVFLLWRGAEVFRKILLSSSL
jgi:hypothetical protein